MKRYLCSLAVLGMILLPDWASACWPIWGRPPAPLYVPTPAYVVPNYSLSYGYPPVFQPGPGQFSYQPTIGTYAGVVTPHQASPQTNTVKPARVDPSSTSPLANRPAAPASSLRTPTGPPANTGTTGTGGAVDANTPLPPKKSSPTTVVPDNSAKNPGGLPPLELPMGSNPGQSPKVNVLETPRKPVLPVAPSPAPADPFSSLQSPPLEKGSGPALTLPGPLAPAVPSAAPPSSELIPPVSNPQLPLSNKPDALPSLTLPPEVPVAPNSRLESISRSSPLTGATKSALQMNVFPVVTADKAMGFYRNVSFFNHTNRAIELTIEGRSVTLPAKNYLEAKLAPSFTWGHDNGATARQNVPDGAAGLDIVFRE